MEKEVTIHEVMDYLIENMATKDDIKDLEIKMDAGFRMVREELEDIKARLTKLEKRTLEDADAAAKDILELRKRIDALEKQVRLLKPAR